VRILVVEDDRGTARYLSKGLSEQGYGVEVAHDGIEGRYSAERGDFDLLILDVMLPEMNGFEILKHIRKKGVATPALFLTAKDRKDDIVHGLDLGADDYLVKPFAFAELLARIKALLRRGQKEAVIRELTIADLRLDRVSRTVRRGGRTIELTAKEFQLLEYMMANAGQVLTRTMLLDHVWGYSFDTGSNVIDVHINRLRAKIESAADVKLIQTVRGVGYVFKTEN